MSITLAVTSTTDDSFVTAGMKEVFLALRTKTASYL
jgi:hypothetical protein